MALKIQDGDYVPDGTGGLETVSGAEALVQRVLFRLQARRGGFPFLESLGSRLWRLSAVAAAQRTAAARQYVAEALSDEENLTIRSVALESGEDGASALTVGLEHGGEELAVELTLQ